ncbi:MAG: hypothetical protein KDB86_03595 [Actinobacteria bacterium]|nr:hypothetical protein [Actinomycetota bacterium]MCB9389990.1 hypothetical protein [Acidimicrobiia bacterium]
MSEIINPQSDTGALVQVLLIIVMWSIAFHVARSDKEARLLITGIALCLIAWRALQAVH